MANKLVGRYNEIGAELEQARQVLTETVGDEAVQLEWPTWKQSRLI
jgi:hypothetical protein